MPAPLPDPPTMDREPACPAALVIAGASRSQQGVVCREMQMDAESDPGLRMNPAQLEKLREAEGGVYLNLKSDPSSVIMLCHGRAVPVVTNDDHQGRASYTYCPVWQEARDRALAGEHGLTDDPEPEPTSMGVGDPFASHEAPDPWAAGVAALDDLAPADGSF